MILKTTNLSFQYDEELVLNNLNLSLQKGDYCALLGPNGSGKTTFVNLLTGLLKKYNGKIEVEGNEIKHLSTMDLARKVAVVPQRQELVYDFNVYDTVMMGRNPYQNRWEFSNENDHQIVMAALQKTKLIHLKNRFTNQLSGGEFQRTLIARAIAQQAPILILDEPLSNLDIAHKFEIMEILHDLNQTQKTTILLILHDFSFAVQYVPLTLLLGEGLMKFFGSTKELFATPLLEEVFELKKGFTIDKFGNVFKNNNL